MKKKILVLLLLLSGVFSFGSIYSKAQAEFVDDNTFVISNADYTINEEDVKKMMLFLNDYAMANDLFIIGGAVFRADIVNDLDNGLYIDFQANLFDLEYNVLFYSAPEVNTLGILVTDYEENVVFDVVWLKSTNEVQVQGIATYNFIVTVTLPEPEPPFTGFINFIKNLLQDLLQSITDMTMHLINNIFDTNLIDINLVVLSDTAIYTGTLNDMLYTVFSIFYVIFAITLVWRVLRKIIRKLFFWDRW